MKYRLYPERLVYRLLLGLFFVCLTQFGRASATSIPTPSDDGYRLFRGPVVLSPSDDIVALVTESGTWLYDLNHTQRRPRFIPALAHYMADSLSFNSDGTLFAVGMSHGPTVLYETATGQEVARFRGTRESVSGMSAFDPTGNFIAVVQGQSLKNHLVWLWNVNTKASLGSFYLSDVGIDTVVFSQDGSLIAACDIQGVVKVWDVRTGVLRMVGRARSFFSNLVGANALGLTFNQENHHLVLVTNDPDPSYRFIWDIDTGALLSKTKISSSIEWPTGYAFTIDGNKVAVAGPNDIEIHDVETAEVDTVIQTEDYPAYIDIGSQRLVGVTGDSMLHLWDLSGKELQTLPLPDIIFKERTLLDSTLS